ncbi:MAG: hypothetical protein HY863_15655 [Chloroflexi bacterium]|nr:hypothetical protein [Chloroflexota bacterium]
MEENQSQDDAKIKSEMSRKALELLYGKAGAPRWIEDYLELAKGGWPWRVAAYIAWASTPKGSREPKTQDELARFHLGLTSDRAVVTWKKKNPLIDQMVHKLQGSPLWKHRTEIITAMVAVAVKPDAKGFQDRKLALTLMGDLDDDKE